MSVTVPAPVTAVVAVRVAVAVAVVAAPVRVACVDAGIAVAGPHLDVAGRLAGALLEEGLDVLDCCHCEGRS